MGTYSRGQSNILARGLPFFAVPKFFALPYIGPEVYAGDTSDAVSGALATTYPAATLSSISVLLNGISQGATYTTTPSDVGKTLQASQAASSAGYAPVIGASSLTTVQPYRVLGPTTRGGNVSAPAEYGKMRLFLNAVLEGRGFAGQGAAYPVILTTVSGASLSFSATSGTGVTMTIGAGGTVALAGNSSDVGRLFFMGTSGVNPNFPQNVFATVTAAGSTTSATVSITGTLTASSFPVGNWYMTIPLDANGWPMIASEQLITATPGVGDGQLAGGTYVLSYDTEPTWYAINGNAVCTLGAGNGLGSVTLVSNVGRRSTYTFVVNTVNQSTTGPTLGLYFSGPVLNVDCPRDGSASSSQLFNPACVAYHSQISCLRLMDFMNTNFRADATWAQAQALNKFVPQHVIQNGGAGLCFAWELAIDFINACALYPGSKVNSAHLCLPMLSTPAYATSLSNLLTSRNPTGPVGTGFIQIYIEDSNECWNPSFYTLNNYQFLGEIDCQILTNGSGLNNNYGVNNYITSVVQSGTSVTVNLSITIASLVSLMGLTVTVGSTLAVANQTDATWNVFPTAASPGTLVTVTAVGTNSFTYVGAPGTHTTLPAGNQFGVFFNPSSNLITDYQSSSNVFNLTTKYHCRKLFLQSQAWTRPQDKFVLGVQFGQVGSSLSVFTHGGNNNISLIYNYAYYIGGSATNWFQAICSAPYINGLFPIAITASAPFTIPAGFLVTGDAVSIGSNYPSSVVCAVSVSGTTATIAGPSTFTASISGTTMTVTATNGFLGQGQLVTGAAGGTVIGTQQSGAPGGAGIYSCSPSQSLVSTAGLIATVPSITATSTNCCIAYPNAAGSGVRLTASMLANISMGGLFYQQMQVNAFQAIYMGKEFYCYEGGPDLSVTSPNMQLTAQVDPSMGPVVTQMMNAFYEMGGGTFNYYTFTPSSFSNGTNGGWNICQNYADTTSPKLTAYLGYNTAYTFSTQSGSPGTALTSQSQADSGITLFTTGPQSGNARFNSSAKNNYIDMLVAFPRGRRYQFTVWATDSTATPFSLYLNPTQSSNGTLMGSATTPINGTGATSASLASAPIKYSIPSGGAYILRIYVPSGSNSAGFLQVAMTTY